MIVKLMQAGCLWIMAVGALAGPANRTYDGNCGAPVTSVADAMLKADFIVEGMITTVTTPDDPNSPPTVVVDNANVIRERNPSAVGRPKLVALGPCFAAGLNALGPASRLEGKRMRFYGNEHESPPVRRFFYMQPADQPLPAVVKVGPPWSSDQLFSKQHGVQVQHPLADGWQRARSTEGKFSVDLPAPYFDETQVQGDRTSFVVKTMDQNGSYFAAGFVPSRTNSQVIGIFDTAASEPRSGKSVFRGLPAVTTREVNQENGMVTYSKLIRVPGGVYMIGTTTSKENEASSAAARERVFNSIAFD